MPKMISRVSRRRFGVEIEAHYPSDSGSLNSRRTLIAEMRSHGLSASTGSWSSRARGNRWVVKGDGSVGSGWEVVSPPLRGLEGLRKVALVLSIMNDLGWWVSTQCGVHVHHDVRNLSVRDCGFLARSFAFFWERFRWFLARGRHNASYAHSPRPLPFDDVLRADYLSRETTNLYGKTQAVQDGSGARDTRYTQLNGQCIPRQNTVEFRGLQGTLDSSLVVAWVVLTQAFVERSRKRNLPRRMARFHNKDADAQRADFLSFLGTPGDVVTDWAFEFMTDENRKNAGEKQTNEFASLFPLI